jgi:phosphatidylcholine synthase
VWAVLAIMAVAANFVVPWWLTAMLCAIGVYILFSDTVIRMTGWNRA